MAILYLPQNTKKMALKNKKIQRNAPCIFLELSHTSRQKAVAKNKKYLLKKDK